MIREPRSISEQIECLAQLTGAPVTFVDQVRALFMAKGISLDATAAPFLEALEEAFRREERIRHTTHRARQNLDSVHQNFQRVGRQYVEQVSKLKGVQNSLQEQSRRMQKLSAGGRKPQQVTIRGDHRTFVTRPEREELPMVPGPADLQ